MAGWNADIAAGPTGPGAVTLVEGSSFCISLQNGDIFPHHPHGVFYQDTRIISRWCLTVNGQPLEPLGAWTQVPYEGTYVGRATRSDGRADSPLTVERRRELGVGIVEDIIIHNYGREPAVCEVMMAVDADFADLFEVKDGRVHRTWEQERRHDDASLSIEAAWQELRKGVVIRALGAKPKATDEGLYFGWTIPAQGEWTVRIAAVPTVDGVEAAAPPLHLSPDTVSPQDRRQQAWNASIPNTRLGNRSVERTLQRAHDDMGALRIVDPQHPERMVVAAGAPWFMALFGRDSLLASCMVLPLDATLALGTLQTLAERQGTKVDPLTEEQPGRILHEVRLGVGTGLALGGKSAYYGTADATPLFVMLLGEASRWGLHAEDIAALIPHADRALDWIRDYGDLDGDGFVEYQRLNDQGLVNQGWKDSWDGINFADGTLAEPPIALCEVQGYVYSAYVARAWMAYEAGDTTLAAELRDSAERLKEKFNEQFWLPDKGYFAVALDRDKRPVDALASNMGHCLWSGIIDKDKAASVVERLMSPEMFSGWGVRTLATTMGAYNPVSYHNGSVWPHDNSLIVAGMLRYGFVSEAQRLATALMEAAEYTDNRLPELFCGFNRSDYPEPLPYPTACSPQAWASGTPVMLIRSLLRYEAHVSQGGLWLDPVLPRSWGSLHTTNLPMAGGWLTLDVTGSRVSLKGLPDGMVLHRGIRPSLADLVERGKLPEKYQEQV
ncbi:glycogen debranching N-terminal domain-containing protein [Arthrobacter sp. ISL-30]|uniref:amylo-alpha-1,6-glucosidase n=1 Tax=Arthrobacter sp. ISL-30 TaxID=2819109 RepID=UPI001BEABBC1|nr:glycogen debranching N-terminal domain-containing protein [Arthrobacter sp. ISL-30]MBT2512099.1 amylo-alpha-1,6-glucosidase [Arthrobacter sp. ISL-30]